MSRLSDRRLFVLGDVHLHAGSAASLGHDLERLVRRITSREPQAVVVFNGDLFDFDRVRGERRSGLGAAPLRLQRTLQAFPGLVQAWGQHLAAGGVLVFVAGNHDAELLLDDVQQCLRESLLQAAHAQRASDNVNERLLIDDRFVCGTLYISHGHQTDPDSCFYPDERTALSKARLSALPLASIITRLLLSHIPRFELMGDNHNTPLLVLARVLRDYRLAALEMIARYPVAGVRIVWHSALAWWRHDVPPNGSMASPWRVAQRLYLDRYFGTVAGVALLVALLLDALPTACWGGLALLVTLLAVPPRHRRKGYDRRDQRAVLDAARARLQEGATLVISGHTHRACIERHEHGTYGNHGAFSAFLQLDDEGRVLHDGEPAALVNGHRRGRPYLRVDPETMRCVLHALADEQPASKRACSWPDLAAVVGEAERAGWSIRDRGDIG